MARRGDICCFYYTGEEKVYGFENVKALNKILLKRRGKFFYEKLDCNEFDKTSFLLTATMNSNLFSYGYCLSCDSFKILCNSSPKTVKKIYFKIKDILSEQFEHVALQYPAFPKHLMDENTAIKESATFLQYYGELADTPWLVKMFQKIYGVLIDISWLTKMSQDISADNKTYSFKQIEIIHDPLPELSDIVIDMLSSDSLFSDTDKDSVDVIIRSCFSERNVGEIIPLHIPVVENLAFLFQVLDNNGLMNDQVIKRMSNSVAVDKVLYLATYLSNTDITNEINFRNFKRSERRFIMGLIEYQPQPIEDILFQMAKNRAGWEALIKKLHPFEKRYAHFKRAITVFDKLLNQDIADEIVTINNAIKEKDISSLVDILRNKPNMFIRSLDFMLCNIEDCSLEHEKIFSVLTRNLHHVPLIMLLSLKSYFMSRNSIRYEAYLPNGDITRGFAREKSYAVISDIIIEDILDTIDTSILKHINAQYASTKRMFVSPSLSNYAIPYGYNKGCPEYGSSFPLNDYHILSLCMYWDDNGYNITPANMSVIMLDDDLEYLAHFDDNTKNGKNMMGCIYHKDVKTALSGSFGRETVTINLNSAKQSGVRYIIAGIFSNHMPADCNLYCGWGYKNKIDDDYYVEDLKSFQVNTGNEIIFPCVIDLKINKLVWMDMNIPRLFNNFDDFFEQKHCARVIQTLSVLATNLSKTKPTLYDLFYYHALARSEDIVESLPDNFEEYEEVIKGLFVLRDRNKKHIDEILIFDENIGITPFDTNIITGQYL